jgi:thiamine phosphate synthase YjbQ (UPF0047 family)
MSPPAEISLELRPQARFDVIDVGRHLATRFDGFFQRYRKAVYCSHHTTAGYLEQSFCARLNNDRESLGRFIGTFQKIFPPGAEYQHDQLHLRSELSEAQRRVEPRNGDSHLTFIGSGLRSCVTYLNRSDTPVYFIDLDGVNGRAYRRRRTTVIGFNREETVERLRVDVPTSVHPIDSVNLKDPRFGLYEELCHLIRKFDIERGRVDITLAPGEGDAALTVNEYETLLMRHDFAEVLRNPLRFMAEKGRNMLLDPRSIPGKTLDYAKYDFVQVLNEIMDALGISGSGLERAVDKFLAFPVARIMRMKRSVSLVVSDADGRGPGSIVEGLYQSPILVQWRNVRTQRRQLDITFTRFS